MQGLMLKLLNVDAAGERALRVVAYFDELLVHRPDLESVVRATAILADCGAGLHLPGEPSARFFTPDGLAPRPDSLTQHSLLCSSTIARATRTAAAQPA